MAKTKLKPLTTIEMEVAIANYFGFRKNIIVPNISWGLNVHECDMFIVNRTGYVTEIEIKRSKADLLNDFKKRHQHVDLENRISEFYFALPDDLLEKCYDLIPINAGIISCSKFINFKKEVVQASIRRKCKKIKGARKLTPEEKLKVASLGTMRIWSLKEKIIKLQNA